MNEIDLLNSAMAGDTAAFGALVRLHQSRVRGFLRRLARGDHALADDLAQEAFLLAWQKITQFRREGSFAGWLARIAYTRYLTAARRMKLETGDESAEIPVHPQNSAVETRLDLEKAMKGLSPPERAALTICYALGYTNEEGAQILDMPVGTLKSHIARGREKLRRILEA